MSRHQNARQSHVIKITNRSFENEAELEYLGTRVINQNLINEEIKSRLNSGSSCYRTSKNLLSSHLLSKNVKIRICETIILSLVFYACETWSLTLREEHRPREFENILARRICGPRRDQVTGSWRKLHNEEFHNLYSSPSIIRMIKLRRIR
jgi:hypothetical protein